jgi:protein-S-isoprenylcysteine O-methyltransferase Ste14
MNDPCGRTPEEVADAAWIKSVGGVTTPLLGGFSLAAVIMVSDGATSSRWAGPAILVLAFAAVVLIAAVQFAQVAGRSYEARADLPVRVETSAEHEDDSSGMSGKRAIAFEWAQQRGNRARSLYHIGTNALLLGLALALVPPKGGTWEYLLWIAAVVTFLAFLLQVKIKSRPANFSSPPTQHLSGLTSWFRAFRSRC